MDVTIISIDVSIISMDVVSIIYQDMYEMNASSALKCSLVNRDKV